MKIFVLIPAYKAQNFIQDCIESVLKQEGVDLHILVGIDGCKETLKVAKKLKCDKVEIYYFPNNNGTYVTFNSLLQFVPSDVLIQRFDADDRMLPDMLRVMSKYTPCFSKYSGISLIHKKYYDALGGFRPWRMAADTEFRDRLLRIYPGFKQLPKLFFRRIHPNQLTQAKETGLKSQARKKHVRFINAQRKKENIKLQIIRYVHDSYCRY